MKLHGIDLFHLASSRMSWLSERQRVVSENVANVHTPGFRTREVSEFSKMLEGAGGSVSLGGTHPGHLQGFGTAGVPGVRVTESGGGPMSLDGNDVVLEAEALKAAEVGEGHRLAAQLYAKGYALLARAAGSN